MFWIEKYLQNNKLFLIRYFFLLSLDLSNTVLIMLMYILVDKQTGVYPTSFMCVCLCVCVSAGFLYIKDLTLKIYWRCNQWLYSRFQYCLSFGCISEVSHYMCSKFHFVDLAGSERAHKTGNVGDRFKGEHRSAL